MIQFANKTDMILAAAMNVVMSTASAVTVTPSIIHRRLGDLARLALLRGTVFLHVKGDGGTGTLKVWAGGSLLAEISVDLDSDTNFYASEVVDLSQASGASNIHVEYVCDSTGEPAQLSCWLEVEHPIVISA